MLPLSLPFFPVCSRSETELFEAHLETVQRGEEVSHLAVAHVHNAEDLAREMFMSTGQHHLVALTQRVQECFGMDTLWDTHCGHRIGRRDRIGEQVQPYRSHMVAPILAQVSVTCKDRFQSFGQQHLQRQVERVKEGDWWRHGMLPAHQGGACPCPVKVKAWQARLCVRFPGAWPGSQHHQAWRA